VNLPNKEASMTSKQGENKLTEGSMHHFAKDMRALINSSDLFSDVEFLVGKEKVLFRGHQCILSARCLVFESMCMERARESGQPDGSETASSSSYHQQRDAQREPFLLPDIDPQTFQLILEFLYTNCCLLTPDNVIDVMSISIEYEIDQLTKLCEKFLLEAICVENAAEAMQAAVMFDLNSLKKSILPFFEENVVAIFATRSFQEMSAEALVYVLQSNQLNIDEADVLRRIKDWALVNSTSLGMPLSEVALKVAPHIRLPLLSPEEMTQLEMENGKERFIPIEQISSAWKHLALKSPLNSTIETTPRKGTRPRNKDGLVCK